MKNQNKSAAVLGQLFGLFIGSGFKTPMEITMRDYPEVMIINR